ncbi:hypothetical protein N3K66_000924 [Trichothecium roseum]|uniref:Uncharacterized protein n=1 Tax=Trichothecium roseum TaxID=47278 RepID=A0ACC0VEZ4_9HYPO|nr:hypothetical protein N3K66_000924 [Trichothecium roseum]
MNYQIQDTPVPDNYYMTMDFPMIDAFNPPPANNDMDCVVFWKQDLQGNMIEPTPSIPLDAHLTTYHAHQGHQMLLTDETCMDCALFIPPPPALLQGGFLHDEISAAYSKGFSLAPPDEPKTCHLKVYKVCHESSTTPGARCYQIFIPIAGYPDAPFTRSLRFYVSGIREHAYRLHEHNDSALPEELDGFLTTSFAGSIPGPNLDQFRTLVRRLVPPEQGPGSSTGGCNRTFRFSSQDWVDDVLLVAHQNGLLSLDHVWLDAQRHCSSLMT